MAAASLIGFGLVLLSVSVIASLVLGGVLWLGERHLREMGPWAERRAATIALLAPPLFGLGVSATIAASNLMAFAAGTDHCLGHSHHLHLCPIHGAYWASTPWAVAAVAFFATYVLARIGYTTWAHVSAQRTTSGLKRSGKPISGANLAFLVPGDDQFAFTIGIFSPTIIISRASWEALDAGQRDALLAHEQAHIAHGDLWKRAAIGLLACFGAPILSQKAMSTWELASERACDHTAARQVGKSSIVASAILLLARSQSKRHAPAVAVFAATCKVTDRVESLLKQQAGGKFVARRLVAVLVFVSVLVAISCVVYSESLHHILETILG